MFQDHISLLELANMDVPEQARKIELAQALLAANELKLGQLAPDPLMSREQNKAPREANLEAALATGAFDDLSHLNHPEWTEGLTSQLEIHSLAWKIVNEPETSIPG